MRPERSPFVTIHGIDGTGKTATTAALATALENRGIATVNYDLHELQLSNPFSAAKERVLRETSPAAQLAFYLGSTLYHSDQISQLVIDGYAVVKSRYLDDVLAHHEHLGVENVQAIAALFPVVQPDFQVVLTLSEHERRRRIEERGIVDAYDLVEKVAGSRMEYFENYLLTHTQALQDIGRAMHIQTDTIKPQEVAEEIIKYMLRQAFISGREV